MRPGNPFRAVVFDMDGTMFDSETLYHRATDVLLKRRGHRMTEELSLAMMGVPGLISMGLLRDRHALEEDPARLYDECQVILRGLMTTELRLMPGLEELLGRIETRGLPKGVATSTERPLTEHMLKTFRLWPRFQFVLTRDDVVNGKPHPEIYLRACSTLGLSPDEVLVIEDSQVGSLSAKAAGCYCVAIPHDLSRQVDFSHADLIADHLLDPKLLELAGLR